MNKIFPLIVLCLTFAGFQARADQPYLCMDGDSSIQSSLGSSDYRGLIQEAALSCSTLELVGSGLELVSIGLDSGAIAMTCTGAGTPVALYLGIGSLATRLIRVTVGNLPCDAATPDDQVKAQVHELVCQELAKQGVKCN